MQRRTGLAFFVSGCFSAAGVVAAPELDSHVSLLTDFVYMQRYHVKNQSIVNDSSVTICRNGSCNSTVLQTKSLVRNFEPGLAATLSYIQDARSAYEIGGMYIWAMDNTASKQGSASLFFPFYDASFAGDFYGADTITARYRSQFYTGEVNYLKTFSRSRCSFFALTGIFGIRYAAVNEKFDVNSYKNRGSSSYNIKVSNDLIGLQVGFDFKIRPFKTFYWDLLAKVGVDLNRVNAKIFLGDDHNAITLRNSSREKAQSGTFAQAAAGAGVQPYDWLNMHVGYQMLFFGGLALAPDQIDRSSFALGDSDQFYSRKISANGYVILHGLYMGVTFTF